MSPGPWKFDPEEDEIVRDATGEWVCCVTESPTREAGVSNGRLIAAAPDLLDALRLLVHDIDKMGITGLREWALMPAMDAASRAFKCLEGVE